MDIRSILMGVSFSVIWSSAFTSARILVTSAPPLMVLSVRFLISGLLGIALARMMGQKIELERKEWLGVVIIGICQNALYLGLNFIGMQWIEAGLAAIIASTLPLIVAIFCWLFLGEKTKTTLTLEYAVENKTTNKRVCTATTKLVFYNFELSKVARVPACFLMATSS